MAMRAAKNLMRKTFWSCFMGKATVYTPASNVANHSLSLATRRSSRRRTRAIRRDVAVDSDLAALAVRPRIARHRRVHAARSIHVAARLRAGRFGDAAGERRALSDPHHAAAA